jgi:hypothetical protein
MGHSKITTAFQTIHLMTAVQCVPHFGAHSNVTAATRGRIHTAQDLQTFQHRVSYMEVDIPAPVDHHPQP